VFAGLIQLLPLVLPIETCAARAAGMGVVIIGVLFPFSAWLLQAVVLRTEMLITADGITATRSGWCRGPTLTKYAYEPGTLIVITWTAVARGIAVSRQDACDYLDLGGIPLEQTGGPRDLLRLLLDE
jgi:hypothetical protein